ncbi:MAG: hypothetical protein U9P10_11625 [Thermodesulfobacteriota bacterium]|nr:hypothetical protein [Thermodesulfobacteriota bacterium]
MTHEDAGHYAEKHKDKKLDEKAAQVLREKSKNGQIACASAHAAAKEVDMTPLEIGVQADLLELRLIKCSNGLFGYEPGGKILKKDISVSDELAEKIKAAAENEIITCAQCWETARTMKISRVDTASACDVLGIRIKKCQLGAF